jgi:hypothetical protein
MERLGKQRREREGHRLSEREASESNPAAEPQDNSTGPFDFASLRMTNLVFRGALCVLCAT